eukprot:GHVU01105673.1.p1 GENE.GHVU01105673.1~~GHVU01105673.1.p1  ORF type:complete len:122 (+),score=11.03 GHVU01105673.1:358-723(+)
MYVAPKPRHAKRRRANATSTRRCTGKVAAVTSAGMEHRGSSDAPSCSGSSSTAGGTGSVVVGGGSGTTGSNQNRLPVIAEGDPVTSGNILQRDDGPSARLVGECVCACVCACVCVCVCVCV